MRFIDKKRPRFRVIGLGICRRILNSCWDGSQYVNLDYNAVDKTDLTRLLVAEQNGYCCYCMRNLHLQKSGNHRQNVTLEHIIPHRIRQEEWVQDRVKYRKFTTLNDRNVTVCQEGVLTDRSKKFGMPPFPHFLSYDNIVASCDGMTLDEEAHVIPHHCCNNKRGNKYIEPLFFHENVSDVIQYDGRGHVQYPDEYEPSLNEDGINITCRFLCDVRLFWKHIANSEYTADSIHEAENDDSLRMDIIDDVFTTDLTGHWFFLMDKNAWCVYSDYEWFYSYYKEPSGI